MRRLKDLLLIALLLAVPSPARAQASDSTEVKQLLAKVFDELGGLERIRSMTGFREQSRSNNAKATWEVDELVVWPDRIRYVNRSDDIQISGVISPTLAYGYLGPYRPGNTWNYKPQAKQDFLDGFIKRNVFFVAQHANDPAYSFSPSGSEPIGAVATRIIDVNGDGVRLRWFVDPESGRILRKTFSDAEGHSLVEDYSDWRTVDDLTIPFRIQRSYRGKAESVEVLAMQISPPADPALFGQPPATLGPITTSLATPAGSRGVLKISSQPGAAQVFLNDVLRGSTDAQGNLTLRAAVGAYALKLTAPGYKDWTQPVTLAARETTSIEARLTPPTAILHLSTRPGQAQAYLNDEFRGITSSEGNLTVASLAPASYRLRLTLIGYKEWTQTLALEAGESRIIEVKLEPAGPKPLELGEVEEALKNGISAKRVAELVKQFGVDFALTDEAEQRLRSSGADSDLLLAISRSKK